MFKVGITSGIGSGKSTVAKVFACLGIPVYNSDDTAKTIMNTDNAIQQQIIQTFGQLAYTNGKINSAYLASQVFNNQANLAKLNAIVHPAVQSHTIAWNKQQTTPYTIKEAAIFFESNTHHQIDWMIGVCAPLPLRIQRVMDRDQATAEAVIERMNKQMDEEKKMALCNQIIANDDVQMVLPQILKIHEELLQKSSQHKSIL